MKKKKLIIILCLLVFVFVFCYLQNNFLTISKYTYKNEKLPSAMHGYQIVQLSDLHNKRFGKNHKTLIKKVAKLAPDMIVLTGDLVDGTRTNIGTVLDLVPQLTDIAPVYYVTGNHEHWLANSDLQRLLSGLKLCGVTILDNETVTIKKETGYFKLTGLDDECLFDNTLSNLQLSAEDVNVLLAHEPQFINVYSNSPVDLVLTGHAHGGQFVLPFIGGLYAPGQGFRPPYVRGVYMRNQTTMVVSRGLGNSIIPLRLFNYPEIVSVTLSK